jgi:tetratricopeptide (TPR) repeat protein
VGVPLGLPLGLALCLSLLGAASACKSEGPKVDPEKQFSLYRETAAFHYANGDYDRTESQARKALELHPDDAKLQLMIAWCQLKREDRDSLLAAEPAFRARLEDGGYEARLGLATTLDRLGKLSQEAAVEIEAGRREPVGARVDPAARAKELREQARARWTEARQQFGEILKAKPADRSALNGSQRVCGYLADWKAALVHSRDLLRSLEADRTFYETQLERTQISLEDERRFKQSLKETQRLASDTLVFASDSLRQLGDFETSIEQLRLAIELEPKRPELYGLRAQRLYEMRRYPEAIVDIDQFLRLSSHPFEHPDVAAAYELRSKCEAGLRG